MSTRDNKPCGLTFEQLMKNTRAMSEDAAKNRAISTIQVELSSSPIDRKWMRQAIARVIRDIEKKDD